MLTYIIEFVWEDGLLDTKLLQPHHRMFSHSFADPKDVPIIDIFNNLLKESEPLCSAAFTLSMPLIPTICVMEFTQILRCPSRRSGRLARSNSPSGLYIASSHPTQSHN